MALLCPIILAPVRFAATFYTLRVTCNAVTSNLRFPAVGDLDPLTDYFMSGDGDAVDLMTMLDATLTTHPQTSLGGWQVTYNADMRVVVTVSLLTMQLLWTHASTTLDPAVFGFADADTTLAASATATGRASGLWRPARPPTEDSRDRQEIIASVASTMDGHTRTARLVAPKKDRDIVFALLAQELVLDEYGGATENTFEEIYTDSLSYGRGFRYYADETTRTTTSYGLYSLREVNAKEAYQRDPTYRLRWRVALPMRRAEA